MRISWGTGIALAYSLFAIATTGFVVFAMHRPVDLVSPDYYQRSMREDERLAAIANVRTLGERFGVRAEGQALTIEFPAVARPDSGAVTLYRASSARDDRTIPLEPTPPPLPRIPRAGIRPGKWTMQLNCKSHGRVFYYEQLVTVP
jgi:hypothetical protein